VLPTTRKSGNHAPRWQLGLVYQSMRMARYGRCSRLRHTRTIPDSLYLSGKPAFFGSNTWPWVDPNTGAVYTLPAKARFERDALALGSCGRWLQGLPNRASISKRPPRKELDGATSACGPHHRRLGEPGMVERSLIGWSLSRALLEHVDAHVVTHVGTAMPAEGGVERGARIHGHRSGAVEIRSNRFGEVVRKWRAWDGRGRLFLRPSPTITSNT